MFDCFILFIIIIIIIIIWCVEKGGTWEIFFNLQAYIHFFFFF